MAFQATDRFEKELLEEIFNGVAITYPAQFYLSLHTADPGEAGDQNTSEAAYTGYSRQPVARDALTWLCATVTGTSTAKLLTKIEFPECGTFAGQTYTYVGIGDSAGGAGYLRLRFPLASPITISTGKTPRILENSYVECD